MPLPFVPMAGTVLAEIFGLIASQLVETTYNFLTTETIDEPYLLGLADNFRAAWVGRFLPLLSSRLSVQQSKATSLVSSTAPSQIFTHSPNAGGVSDASGPPNNVALAMKNTTAKRGKSYRGRNFLMGIPNSALDSDRDLVTNTFIGDLLDAYDDFMNDMVLFDPNIVHVVCSRQEGGVRRTTGVRTPVNAVSINNVLDSQRRRLTDRGN
jgi:hypothetical protein